MMKMNSPTLRKRTEFRGKREGAMQYIHLTLKRDLSLEKGEEDLEYLPVRGVLGLEPSAYLRRGIFS